MEPGYGAQAELTAALQKARDQVATTCGNGFHAFRHANATLMNSFGASLKLRQERLGHAQGSRVTETIYTHVISEDARRIAAQLGEAVWGRILDPGWTQEAKRPSVESAKPFHIN